MPETLASNLTVRFLSLKRFPEVAAALASLAKLLCMPLLWLRCPVVLLNVSHVILVDMVDSCLYFPTVAFLPPLGLDQQNHLVWP